MEEVRPRDRDRLRSRSRDDDADVDDNDDDDDNGGNDDDDGEERHDDDDDTNAEEGEREGDVDVEPGYDGEEANYEVFARAGDCRHCCAFSTLTSPPSHTQERCIPHSSAHRALHACNCGRSRRIRCARGVCAVWVGCRECCVLLDI